MQTLDNFGIYRRDIRSVPLLSRFEEISLAQTVRRAVLAAKAQGRPLPTKDRDPDALADYIQMLPPEAVKAIQRLVSANLRLAVVIALKYATPQTLVDFCNEAAIGLQYAILKFDPEKGYRLCTYAYNWMRQSCQRATGIKDTIIIPVHAQTMRRQYSRIYVKHLTQTGEHLSNAQIAKKMDIPVEKLEELILNTRPAKSLDALINDDQSLLDRVAFVEPEYDSEAARVWGELRQFAVSQTHADDRPALEKDLAIYERHHRDGVATKQIANELGVPDATVRGRLAIMTRKLREVADRMEKSHSFRRDRYGDRRSA